MMIILEVIFIIKLSLIFGEMVSQENKSFHPTTDLSRADSGTTKYMIETNLISKYESQNYTKDEVTSQTEFITKKYNHKMDNGTVILSNESTNSENFTTVTKFADIQNYSQSQKLPSLVPSLLPTTHFDVQNLSEILISPPSIDNEVISDRKLIPKQYKNMPLIVFWWNIIKEALGGKATTVSLPKTTKMVNLVTSPETVSNVKTNESHITQSISNITQSISNITQSISNITQSISNITQSISNITQSNRTGMTDSNPIKSTLVILSTPVSMDKKNKINQKHSKTKEKKVPRKKKIPLNKKKNLRPKKKGFPLKKLISVRRGKYASKVTPIPITIGKRFSISTSSPISTKEYFSNLIIGKSSSSNHSSKLIAIQSTPSTKLTEMPSITSSKLTAIPLTLSTKLITISAKGHLNFTVIPEVKNSELSTIPPSELNKTKKASLEKLARAKPEIFINDSQQSIWLLNIREISLQKPYSRGSSFILTPIDTAGMRRVKMERYNKRNLHKSPLHKMPSSKENQLVVENQPKGRNIVSGSMENLDDIISILSKLRSDKKKVEGKKVFTTDESAGTTTTTVEVDETSSESEEVEPFKLQNSEPEMIQALKIGRQTKHSIKTPVKQKKEQKSNKNTLRKSQKKNDRAKQRRDDCFEYNNVIDNKKTVRATFQACKIKNSYSLKDKSKYRCVLKQQNLLNENGSPSRPLYRIRVYQDATPKYRARILELLHLCMERQKDWLGCVLRELKQLCTQDTFFGKPKKN